MINLSFLLGGSSEQIRSDMNSFQRSNIRFVIPFLSVNFKRNNVSSNIYYFPKLEENPVIEILFCVEISIIKYHNRCIMTKNLVYFKFLLKWISCFFFNSISLKFYILLNYLEQYFLCIVIKSIILKKFPNFSISFISKLHFYENAFNRDKNQS